MQIYSATPRNPKETTMEGVDIIIAQRPCQMKTRLKRDVTYTGHHQDLFFIKSLLREQKQKKDEHHT